LAPLHGVTNRVFRNAYFRRFPGFDSAVAPFILAVRSAGLKGSHFKDLLPEHNAGIPLVPQVLGNDPESFVETAKALADFGYGEINWNLGCPYPMVANKKRGAGLLPYPDAIGSFLDAACARSALPISVKLRLGRYDAREILALAPVLNAHPLAKVIVHPRVGIQMYEGEVDLDGFAAAAALMSHEVVYNGDIRDAAVFASLRARFPFVSEWMIGRWALCDPFLPARIKGAAVPGDPVPALEAFHEDLYRSYRDCLSGPKHVLDKMKEIWWFLCRSVPDSGTALKKIERAKSLEAYEAAVRAAFTGNA
jgi:tRNA-dihydrouridine synthase